MKIKQGKMRILLACADEPLLKQTKRRMQASNELELVGCTSNGTKAWEMIRQKTPDMVVLDTDLPYADGFAVASWMRQNKMWDTSIILLSSFIGGQTYVECSLLHINVLLRKPICADALYERIKLAVTCTSRGDTVEQRLAQILRELGMREPHDWLSVCIADRVLVSGDQRCQHHQDHLSQCRAAAEQRRR